MIHEIPTDKDFLTLHQNEALPKIDRQGIQFGFFWISWDRLAGWDGEDGEARRVFWKTSIFAENLQKWVGQYKTAFGDRVLKSTDAQIAEERTKASLPPDAAPRPVERSETVPSSLLREALEEAASAGAARRELRVGDMVRVLPIVAELRGSEPHPRPGIVREMVEMVGKTFPVEEVATSTDCVDVNGWVFLTEWVELVSEAAPRPVERSETEQVFTLIYRDNGESAWWSVVEVPERGLHPDGFTLQARKG